MEIMRNARAKTTLIVLLAIVTLGILLSHLQRNTVMHSRKKEDNLIFMVNQLNALCRGSNRQTVICNSVRNITGFATNKRLYLRAWSRLGNNIFQYAALYALAHQTGRVPVFIKGTASEFLYMFDSISIPVIEELPPDVDFIQEKYSATFDPNVIQQIQWSSKDIVICCHFESYKYSLPKFTNVLRQELVIRESLRDEMTLYLGNLTKEFYQYRGNAGIPSNITYIGVHVRRGDMAWIINGFNLPSPSYFYKAMDYYRSKYSPVLFVIISQEKDWAIENIKAKDIVFSMKEHSYEDFTLLTLCNHTIGSVGTFSWWGGWIAGGEMIYYSDYFQPGTETALKHNSWDIFPEHWIGMA